MGETGIQWTDATWMVSTGCSKVSPGCAHCFAETLSATRLKRLPQYVAATDENGDWTGKITLLPGALNIPLHWKKPRKIFVNSMSDLFHPLVPFEFIKDVWRTMACCPQHFFQILTKRPEIMANFVVNEVPRLDNVMLGTSVEGPDNLHRIDTLRAIPAAVRFVSFEPLLQWIPFYDVDMTGIRWSIIGGESGPHARTFASTDRLIINRPYECIKLFLDAMQRKGVSRFVKQLGTEEALCNGWKDRHGSDPSEWPSVDDLGYDTRVREFPIPKGMA